MVKKKSKAKAPPKIAKSANARAKTRPKGRWSRVQFVAVGIDVSLYSISIAGCARLSDGKMRRAQAIKHAWEKDDDYFTVRMKEAAKPEYFMFDLFSALKVEPELAQVFIAIEEAVSFGHIQRNAGQAIKQQIQISGALIGGLLRYGWPNLFEIQANTWRKVVADDLGITTHHTKWNPTKKEGKFRAKEWVQQFHPKWDGHWPDMIRSNKRGLIPQPETSKAQPEQSDDRYEALAIMEWMRRQDKEIPF